jgi:hypothetical protein
MYLSAQVNWRTDRRFTRFSEDTKLRFRADAGYLVCSHQLETLVATTPSGPSVQIVRAPKQVQHRLDKSETAQLVAGYKAGKTVHRLAGRFGIHRETVAMVLKRQGVPRRRLSLTPAQVAQALSLYTGGQPLKRIGFQLGCHPDTVRRALGKTGRTTSR